MHTSASLALALEKLNNTSLMDGENAVGSRARELSGRVSGQHAVEVTEGALKPSSSLKLMVVPMGMSAMRERRERRVSSLRNVVAVEEGGRLVNAGEEGEGEGEGDEEEDQGDTADGTGNVNLGGTKSISSSSLVLPLDAAAPTKRQAVLVTCLNSVHSASSSAPSTVRSNSISNHNVDRGLGSKSMTSQIVYWRARPFSLPARARISLELDGSPSLLEMDFDFLDLKGSEYGPLGVPSYASPKQTPALMGLDEGVEEETEVEVGDG